MISENPKEEILKKVRQALGKGDYLLQVPELASPVLKPFQQEDIVIQFAETFIGTKGIFFFCENENDFLQNLITFLRKYKLENIHCRESDIIAYLQKVKVNYYSTEDGFDQAQVGITLCESLVARTGSVIVSSGTEAGRRLSIFPHMHIIVAYTSQIVNEISDGLALLRKKYKNHLPSMISLVTGPSRTADIEKTLVLGAHGPKDLVLFLIDDTSTPDT